MAFIVADRVRETSASIGTGDFNLVGAIVGYQSFSSAIGNGNTTYYAISNPGVNEWEVGIGTVNAGTLTRNTVLASSTGTSLVSFTVGSKDVFCTYPSEAAVFADNAVTLTNKTINLGSNTLVATSAQLASAVSDETGSGSLVFANSPTLTSPTLNTSAVVNYGTANQVQFLNGSKQLVGDADLTFDGTTLSATNITSSGSVTLSGGTANGVAYLNGSKVLTTGSALTFDGANLATARLLSGRYTSDANGWGIQNYATSAYGSGIQLVYGGAGAAAMWVPAASSLAFGADAGAGTTEKMRLTSTGLGIGTSSPSYKLDVNTGGSPASATAGTVARFVGAGGAAYAAYTGIVGGTNGGAGITLGDTSTALKGVIYYSNSNNQLGFGTNGNYDQLVLNSSGNLGLGVTPSAWGGYKAFQISSTGSLVCNGVYNIFSNNWYYDGSTDRYIVTGQAVSQYYQNSGAHVWRTAPSGTAGNPISFTQAMTLDASGTLNVATGNVEGYDNLTLKAYAYGTNGTVVNINSAGTGGITKFSINNTERMRIDSSGNLLVGTTTVGGVGHTIAGGSYPYHVINNNAASSGQVFISFRRSGTEVGYIAQNGTTATSYSTTSDYRLKENIQPMQNALGVVAQLNPVTYKWRADGSDGQGFIAHELQAVVPDCVTGEKDAVDAEGNPVYQGIDTSFLVATLTKAIQEQQEQINQLKAEVAALKGA